MSRARTDQQLRDLAYERFCAWRNAESRRLRLHRLLTEFMAATEALDPAVSVPKIYEAIKQIQRVRSHALCEFERGEEMGRDERAAEHTSDVPRRAVQVPLRSCL